MDALVYAAGVYALTFAITLVVWIVILAIRWGSADRVKKV
jgi:hypothetical protein